MSGTPIADTESLPIRLLHSRSNNIGIIVEFNVSNANNDVASFGAFISVKRDSFATLKIPESQISYNCSCKTI